MADDEGTDDAATVGHEFVWVDEDQPVLGGQWMLRSEQDDEAHPVVLAEAVAAHRTGQAPRDPLPVHVRATLQVVQAAGQLEDDLFPDAAARLQSTLLSGETGTPEIDPDTPEGERVRQGAEALQKLSADLAELVEEQLDGGSLAHLPPDTTRALCEATQTAWRMRRLVDPPGPLYL